MCIALVLLAAAVQGCGGNTRSSASANQITALPSPLGFASPTRAATPTPSAAPHGVFTVTPALPADQDFDPIALLPDGRVFLVGAHSATAETYDPIDNTFKAETLPASLDDYTLVQLKDGRLLGVDASEKIVVLYEPVTGAVSPTGSMVRLQLNYQTTRLSDGRLLFTGGTDSAGDPLRVAQIYDPATGKFTITGSMTIAREGQSATLLADGRVLVAGGDQGDSGSNPSLLASAEIYDPATGRFTETKPMLAPRSQFGAVLMEDGRVLSLAEKALMATATWSISPAPRPSIRRSPVSMRLRLRRSLA